jgi:isoleucyl-tRNA synthetase
MEAARRAVELGRAARAQAKVKTRQPLAKAVIVATEAERRTIEGLADVVASELNVKALEFVTEEGELASYAVRPNFRSLGPRFGKDMPQAKAAIEALDPDHARAAIAGEREIGITIDGREHTLRPEDMTLVMQPLEGYQVESESGRAVALALDLDEGLIREGLAREVVRAVQNARKDAGLDITDRIALRLGGDEELVAAARAHEEYVAGETLATSVSYEAAGDGAVDIGGRKLAIGVERQQPSDD